MAVGRAPLSALRVSGRQSRRYRFAPRRSRPLVFPIACVDYNDTTLAERPGYDPYHSERPQPHRESEASSPVPPMGERQSWSEAPHEQLVGAFRGLIQQERQAEANTYAPRPPAIIIGGELWNQVLHHASPDPLDKQRAAFYRQIHTAWEIIANEQYEVLGRGERSALYPVYEARERLFNTYKRAKERHEPRPEIITLDPQQVRILDALAEAADVPHQRGQAELEIPQYIREDEDRGFVAWGRAEIEKRRGRTSL